MRRFTSGATFYMLDAGEVLTKAELNHTYYPADFVIWPRGNKWDVRENTIRGWEPITDRLFDSENEAFNFAYDNYCADEERKRRR